MSTKAAILSLSLLVAPASASAQHSVDCNSFSAGETARSSRFTKVSALGQPPGYLVSKNTSHGITIIPGFFGCVFLLPAIDTNGNGVPDELDPDNDSDGSDDLDEHVANTDHNDPSSIFQATVAPNPARPDQTDIHYSPAFATRIYRILWSSSLAPGTWTELTKGVTTDDGTGGQTTTDPAEGEARRFYKIEIEIAPTP